MASVKFVARDGVSLAYEEAGAGDPPIVLLHGMSANRGRMMPLFDHLQTRHRVIITDLRGHGESDKPTGDYTIDTFVADILYMLNELEIRKPVLIGHSLGGSISLALATTHPEVPRALVLLDSGIRRREAKAADLGDFYDSLGGPDHDRRMREFAYSGLVIPTDGEEIAELVAESLIGMRPDIFISMARGSVTSFDSFASALECTLPALLILSSAPFTDRTTIEQLGPNWQVAQAVGTGHCLQMVVPDQVNAMLDRFLMLLPEA